MAVRFPRTTIIPSGSSWARPATPDQSLALDSKAQRRERLATSRVWEDAFPPIPNDDEGRAFMAQIDEFARKGTVVAATPYSHARAIGRVIEGSPGRVNGAGQLGQQLVTDGWPAGGTFGKGDYLVVEGVQYPLFIAGPATVDAAGNVTFDLLDSIWSGQSPADDAIIRLNGPLPAHIESPPEWPRTPDFVDYYSGMRLRFRTHDAEPIAPAWDWDATGIIDQEGAARTGHRHSVNGSVSALQPPVAGPTYNTFHWYRIVIEPQPGGWNLTKVYIDDSLSTSFPLIQKDFPHFRKVGKAGLITLGATSGVFGFTDVPDNGNGADYMGPFRAYRTQYVRASIDNNRQLRVVRDAGGIGGISTGRTGSAQNTSGSPALVTVQLGLCPYDRVELWTVGVGAQKITDLPPALGVWGADSFDCTGDVIRHTGRFLYADDALSTLDAFRLGGSIVANGTNRWTAQGGAIFEYNEMPAVDRMVVQCQVLKRGTNEATPLVAALIDTAWP